MKLFGIGVRVPRADGENLVVQGPQTGVTKAVNAWSTRLGRTISEAGKAAAFGSCLFISKFNFCYIKNLHFNPWILVVL